MPRRTRFNAYLLPSDRAQLLWKGASCRLAGHHESPAVWASIPLEDGGCVGWDQVLFSRLDVGASRLELHLVDGRVVFSARVK